jgi:hypothetical protein
MALVMPENVFADGYEAAHLTVDRSAVKSLQAGSVAMDRSGVQRLTADTVKAERAGFGIVNASTAELSQCAAGVIAGDYVKVEESRVFILLAPRVSGNVKAFLTLPAAFAFGAGYFIARRLAAAMFDRPKR